MPTKFEAFDLLLFHREVQLSCDFLEAGVSGIIVDLEHSGKHHRQAGFDTEINAHRIEDIRRLRDRTKGFILCRLSGPDASEEELSGIIESGADEIIVPMVRAPEQVERIARIAEDLCRIMVMIETVEATRHVEALCALPIGRIYVGLNDLRIDRKSDSIFAPLADGLLPALRQRCSGMPFGFGGLTLPELGAPLPARHLYAEMARLDCGFSFLRRSFYRDTADMDPAAALLRMRRALSEARGRGASAVQGQHREMVAAIEALQESNARV
ncbi:hypothetical protein [Hoeflea marina]|uniref:hypothetical protein n=1 Tax=Hoeflea marina TaxID=274592 RepID=UPI001304F784|nr:hypothetical protein [Hoeflea marina]